LVFGYFIAKFKLN